MRFVFSRVAGQPALFLVELSRDDHVHEQALATSPESLQHGKPAAAEDPHFARLRAGVERDLRLSLERGDLHGRTQCRLRDREVDGRVHVVALADETIVVSDVHLDVRIAGAPALRT